MERKKASDFPQEVLDLFHLYVHGDINRRAFLDRAGKLAVGGLTTAALLQTLKANYAWAEQVPPHDKRIKAETATVPSPNGNGSIKGYLVPGPRPTRNGPRSSSCTRTAASIPTSKTSRDGSARRISWHLRRTA